MNAGIAELLRDRISTFAYIDKIAGLVRPITFQRPGPDGKTVNIIIPVGIDVVDPLACDESTQLDLVPDEKYRTIVYFEDRGVTIGERQGRATRVSHIRLVCWVNTSKLNGDNTAGDRMAQDFDGAMNGAPYNSDAFLGIRHRVEGFPAKGPGLFGQYTYPDGVRQYLMWPFDAFAIDIATEYMPNPACIVPVDVNDVACWAPPATRRRRNPKDFTCEELTDPDTGLTAEQLGPACLDCGPGGTCTGVDILDNLGNLIAHVDDGDTYTITPMILPYDNRAAALADATTIPTTAQMVVINDTGRMYHGNGADDVAALVANPQVMYLPVREDGALLVTVEGVEYKLQLNA